jgi:hypothetical protein
MGSFIQLKNGYEDFYKNSFSMKNAIILSDDVKR